MIKRYLFLFLILAGCRKEPSQKATLSGFSKIFQEYWEQMDANYVYWDMDTTNWDNIYKTYQPLFAKSDINSNTAYTYFEAMSRGLIDAHYSISFTLDGLSGRFIYPAANRKVAAKDFHSPYNYTSIDTSYLDKGFKTGYYITSDNKRLQVISGVIQDSILYFNCNLFALKEAYTAAGVNTARDAIAYFLQKSRKALIIDVRNNSGGNIEDLNFLVGRLIDKPLHFGFTRYKNGSGRMDYTPWIDATIEPQAEGTPDKVPTIVLTDNFTISLAEAVAMAMHCMPGVTVIGEKTWGATGPVTANSIYNDGPFTINNILSVYTSSAAFKYIDGKVYEGIGYPPDIAVSPDNLNAGKDDILNKAVELIKN